MSSTIKEQLENFKPDYISVSIESLTKAFVLWEHDVELGKCLNKVELDDLSVEEVSAQRAEALMGYLTTGIKNGI